MLYTKQQAADKINDIYAEHHKGPSMNLPDIERVLEKLNNREVVSLRYFVTEPLAGVPNDFEAELIEGTYDFTIHSFPQITVKLKMLVLHPFGEAWTDDISMRLLSLSGLRYDQSLFDHVLDARYKTYKANRNKPEMDESELFDEFIKAQNDLI